MGIRNLGAVPQAVAGGIMCGDAKRLAYYGGEHAIQRCLPSPGLHNKHFRFSSPAQVAGSQIAL
jgi:hypothetical protein